MTAGTRKFSLVSLENNAKGPCGTDTSQRGVVTRNANFRLRFGGRKPVADTRWELWALMDNYHEIKTTWRPGTVWYPQRTSNLRNIRRLIQYANRRLGEFERERLLELEEEMEQHPSQLRVRAYKAERTLILGQQTRRHRAIRQLIGESPLPSGRVAAQRAVRRARS